ncbi:MULTISPECIES: radical SAM protein [Pseudoalteromonas]|uniref:Radical SAM core domain-containing protein n=1 Tax=Pseudoalteromonas amylolytica TaxID=1859457 RepID=A0A1S1MWP4_9GAMM|nr:MULTISPECIES: radical SAM protein [Pseudoalteromonas]OHU88457.1 hypothetical protein BFC16_07115 [Pseudoalteromonas sp. JW3]OHU90300.1 hypothetical protein BET10_12945 [Pseudoalteromonas amylolytica]
MAFSAAIVKLNSVCNLNCSYCYMFNGPDRTFEETANKMDVATATLMIDEIAVYCVSTAQQHFKVTLHGGEPTLWPVKRFAALFEHADELNRKHEIAISFSIQSNGISVPDGLLALCLKYQVSISVSIDGPQQYNDEFRVDHSGHGSYQRIMKTVQHIANSEYKSLLSGFLSVINLNISPQEYFDWIKTLPVTRIDVLWPIEINHDTVKQDVLHDSVIKQHRYGKWQQALFNIWMRNDDPSIYIRSFFNILTVLHGSKAHIDSIGNDVLNMFVVNTQGQIEYPDYFRSAKDGGCKTDLHISGGVSQLEQEPMFAKLLKLKDYRPLDCQQCPHKALCGGGFLPGRVKGEQLDLSQKSILCDDHYMLFDTVKSVLGQG